MHFSRSLVLALSTLIDLLYYKQLTFPPLRFLYFNIAQSLAVFYGKNRWDYYLTEGYPLLLTTFLPFGISGIYSSISPPSHPPTYTNSSPHTKTVKYQLATTALLVTTVLSLISHKEVRFIYPLLPMLHVLAATPITTFFLPAISPALPHPNPYTPKRFLLSLLLIANVLIAILTTTAHQPAPINVLAYLRNQHSTHYLQQPPPNTLGPAPSTMTVGFLTPCHSTPWRSHLVHPSIKAWALTCEPPLNLSLTERKTYLDEADQFYTSPKAWLRNNLGEPPQVPSPQGQPWWLSWFPKFGRRKRMKRGFGREDLLPQNGITGATPMAWDGKAGKKVWPEYVVFFEQLEPVMKEVGKEGKSAYKECWRGWNSWGHDDWRRRGDLIVWCLRRQGKGQKEQGWWGWG